jgi:predicted ATPase
MIRSLEIHNFRCFEHVKIDDCRRVNVIVGDNGAGKTALAEAIFLTLASTPEVAVRFRAYRGLDGNFAGPPKRLEEALWRDLFFDRDWDRVVSVQLNGDGQDARRLTISRGEATQLTIALNNGRNEETRTAPLVFDWRDSSGIHHRRTPKLTSAGLQIEGSDEDLPDFFYFPANQTISAGENAARFSDLSQAGSSDEFVRLFTKEYPWIADLNVEVIAGAPSIFATLKDSAQKLPLAMVSGGINRIVGILLAVAARPGSSVIVDEIENGLYHKHQPALWRNLLTLTRRYNSQLFLTTHSEEWIEALFEAVGKDISDIALWRIERTSRGPRLKEFSGEAFKAGILSGREIR